MSCPSNFILFPRNKKINLLLKKQTNKRKKFNLNIINTFFIFVSYFPYYWILIRKMNETNVWFLLRKNK